MKHGDIIFGVIGTGSTIGFAFFNGVLASIAGVLTILVMSIRLLREYKRLRRESKDDAEELTPL